MNTINTAIKLLTERHTSLTQEHVDAVKGLQSLANVMARDDIPEHIAGLSADMMLMCLLVEYPQRITLQHHAADLSNCVQSAGRVLRDRCHGAAAEAGWWSDLKTGEPVIDRPHVIGEKLMLIVSEVAEAMEGHRKGLMDDKLPHRTMIEVELADAVIRIADLAGAMKLDLGGAIAEKMAFNAQRPDHKPEARMAAGGKAY
jgi:NTP pyrophosphatase (non-canonical NTP hydrolase)